MKILPTEKAFELQNARKSYPATPVPVVALDDASIDIAAGTSLAIMGRSGSGKSTLLGLMGLMDKPTSGVLKLFGKDISDISDHQSSRMRNEYIGFVFQSDYLLPRLTILENVILPLTYAHKSDQQREAGLRALANVGLGDKHGRRPHQLSGGERQRAALARAIVNRPKILLADEPTGNLDTRTASEIMQLILQINTTGVTVVIVTHDERVASRCRDRVLIEDGRLLS